jgi:isoleucyl-tRNA synthetase
VWKKKMTSNSTGSGKSSDVPGAPAGTLSGAGPAALPMKDTINLPITDFPMKGNLPEREPKMIDAWLKQGLYAAILKKNEGRPTFTLPDGPPYANGDIHIGHVLNKCLKDFTIKYRNMAGFRAAFIPGWDCHGLPIEHKVTKDLGPKRKDKTNAEIRELCRSEALKWVDRQREQFKRLGILADWENPYLTLQAEYEAEEVRELARCLDRGVMYRGEKPVYWCPAMQTALAEAEVEYHPHTSPSIYVKFPFTEGAKKFAVPGSDKKPVSIMIWTTTPWTLPANLGITFHPDFDYTFYDAGDEIVMIAKALKESVEKETGLTLHETGPTIKGAELERLHARHPFIERDSLLMLGDHVSLDAGTGAVHTAPGHGQDDYIVGLRYGLPVYSPIDAEGRYTDEVPEYKGVKIWDANALIVERLREISKLVSFKTFEHQYPHNWRSKTPLIFRATAQWFLGMDLDEKNPDKNIRTQALRALDEVKFVPAWGESRIRSMVENRPDWCLSRQRTWGVPIPVFYCTAKGCEEALVKSSIFLKVAEAMEKGGGIEAYHRTPESVFTSGHACAKCGSLEFRRGLDILDVWFDSGICHAAVQDKRKDLTNPADVYLEGSDQHRGWFQTSLLSSIAAHGRAPFKALVTHGFVMDPKGRKMSKSLGNVVDPAETTKKSGAEILRLWVSYEDFGQDVGCGPESFARVTETYRRFRNTMRFLIGNISDFDPAKDQIEFSKMTALDQWALGRLNELIKKSTAAYDGYEFYKVYHALNHFFTVDLSAGYLDMLKDRLYTFKKNGLERRSAQTVLFTLLHHLVRIMAPITSFLAEETLTYIPGPHPSSVFLMEFPKPNLAWDQEGLAREMSALFEVRTDVSKSLEELRQTKTIGSGLDAKVEVIADGEQLKILEKYEALLPEFFIVSQVSLKMGGYKIETKKADGEKCERCWYFSPDIGASTRYPTVCKKCSKALE